MRLVRLRELLLFEVLLLISYCECEYLRATTNNYNIGFDNIHNSVRNSSSKNQTQGIGFENLNKRLNTTTSRKPTHHVTTTPSYRPTQPRNTRKPNKVTSPPKRPYVTTFRPAKPVVTTRPHPPRNTTTKPSKPRQTLPPKRPVSTTHKPLKPKFTTTTTPKPTRPTLPPSIYVKPNISKVIIPPANSVQWKPTPLPVGWQPNVITTTPSWENTQVVQPTYPQPNQNYNNADFGVFLMYLHDFTRKAEHNHQIKYKRHKGDQFDYYYEIFNYYNNGSLVAKNYRVSVDLLKNCQTNTSQVMCLPNTNAICLTNGTTMCVTHLSATVPCENYTSYCAITYVPCDGRYQSCIGKNEPFYVGIPCVSRVLLIPSNNDFYQQLTVSPIEYCVTSVITPKRLYSPVGSFMTVLVNNGRYYFNYVKNSTLNYLLK